MPPEEQIIAQQLAPTRDIYMDKMRIESIQSRYYSEEFDTQEDLHWRLLLLHNLWVT